MKNKFIALFVCMLFIANASAKMPFYNDDAEFERCVQMTGDWDRCMSEETRRALNDTKILYRDVLSNPKLMNWNGNFEKNQQVLRDLYSSWTAFRNRLCSLAKVSVRYTGGWKDEELSCNLYYVRHHKDHFQCINDMLLSRADERDNFISDEHDTEYAACIADSPKDKCLQAEFQRSSAKIKDLYSKFYNLQATKAWNNGADLGNGNYRDMFDSWVAYRNRLCSLSEYAYKNFPDKQEVSKNYCLQYLNREKLETLENLYSLATSAVNDAMLQKKSQDSGRFAGQKITPLEKRIETTESLIGNKMKQKQPEKTAEKEKSAIPTWGKKVNF